MQLRIMTEPQEGATYDDLLALAQESERLGFDAFFRSDHLLKIDAGDPGPGSTDAWATLAGLARETSRIRLGTMVTSATFRRPGVLAITVATVDAMSGGRVEIGLGTGWYEQEHAAFGIPFPPVGERFDMPRGTARHPHRSVVDAAGRAVLLRRHALLAGRQPGAAQAGAAAAPAGHHRRHGRAPHPGARRALRRGVQRAVPAARRDTPPP